jgi:hypothetical protein
LFSSTLFPELNLPTCEKNDVNHFMTFSLSAAAVGLEPPT